jgi:methylthioribose-1-phosphate isomerase
VRNPAFDITPHEWISGFITDRGFAVELGSLF